MSWPMERFKLRLACSNHAYNVRRVCDMLAEGKVLPAVRKLRATVDRFVTATSKVFPDMKQAPGRRRRK